MRTRAYQNRRGLRPRRPLRGPGGFIMMFTLIAVALAGFVMVETAPDFSNYAVLARSRQFDMSLQDLRQAISSRPFFLTTADGIGVAGAPNEVLTPDEIKASVESLVITSGDQVSASELYLSTTPVDPYVPARERSEVFWSASYNFVENPAFYSLSTREARDPRALQLFYVPDAGGLIHDPIVAGGNTTIVRTNRFGRDHQSIVSSGSEWRHVSASPDGSRVLAAANIRGDGSFEILTSDVNGASRSYATATPPVGPEAGLESLPEWAPRGNLVSFRRRVPDIPPFTYRMIIKAPEVDAVEQDPITANQAAPVTERLPVGAFQGMGPGVWSPNGELVAFWVDDGSVGQVYIMVYNVERERFLIPGQGTDPLGVTYVAAGSCADCPTAKPWTPIAWMPDSNGFLYVNTAEEVVYTHDLILGAAGYQRNLSAGTSFTNAHQLLWLPLSSPGSGVSSSTAFLALTPDGPDGDTGEIWRRRITDPPEVDFRLAENVYTGFDSGSNKQRSHHAMAVSPGGSRIAYVDAGRKTIHMMGVDGARPRELFDFTTVSGSSDDLSEVGFLRPPPAWSYSPTAVKKITHSSLAGFDQQSWRRFTQAEALYPGDSRFGDGHLRVIQPENAEQFLFDNGMDIFRIARHDPTVPRGNKVNGKVEPTWGFRNVNYISRESQDITGGFPRDVFKQVIGGATGSGTTVLITTGTAPAYGPDNRMLAVSKLMSDHTTFPPDTTVHPPVDTDIWIVEANGAPDPPPRNLTPATTATAEMNPAFSPDGRWVYFQRESQQTSKFLGNHGSGIYRVTAQGGSVTQVVGEGSIPPAWNEGFYVSSLEFYDPAVSPDGTRLAFIAKERLLGLGSLGPTVKTTRVGEVIGEALYVKDLLFNTAPVCLLRSYDREVGIDHTGSTYLPKLLDGSTAGTSATPVNDSCYADHSFWKPRWSGSGEEIFLTRTYPRNRWFPKKGFHRTGDVGIKKTYLEMIQRSQIIRVKVTHPRSGIQQLPDSSFDPPADNFAVLVRNVPDAGNWSLHGGTYEALDDSSTAWDDVPGGYQDLAFDWTTVGLGDPNDPEPERRVILNAVPATTAQCMQRVTRDEPAAIGAGVSLGTDYVLSGYVRTHGGTGGLHAGQIMCQLLNNQGLMVGVQDKSADVYQIGLADIGGTTWTRFSAGIRFDLDPTTAPSGGGLLKYDFAGAWGDLPPYTLLIMLYSIGGVGVDADFTGIKMEKAFDASSLAPTAFAPGWLIHSSSQLPDPRRPASFIFER